MTLFVQCLDTYANWLFKAALNSELIDLILEMAHSNNAN